MGAADYRHRVTIEQPIKSRNELREEVITYSDLFTTWAAIEPLRGREYFASQQVNAEITTRIRLRYRAGITSEMRVKFGSRVFEIVSPPINVEERNREIHLMTKEVI